MIVYCAAEFSKRAIKGLVFGEEDVEELRANMRDEAEDDCGAFDEVDLIMTLRIWRRGILKQLNPVG